MTILPFTSPEMSLSNAGGKGANLARLACAGFPVPGGFLLATDAYRLFVEGNELQAVILQALANLSGEDAQAQERASAQIRAAFAAGKMPPETESAIRQAYEHLSQPAVPPSGRGGAGQAGSRGEGKPVAVRSSATTEDLPDLSFAGQQDTFLNVIGEDQLLEAVIRCWSSLWTGRAIGYRIRNGIRHEEAALAVVVQEMVQSEASGVLFTANPLTGLRSESAIDATLGLGEALVSGQVEPDHYIVDTASGAVLSKMLGAKKIATRGKPGGGVETIQEDGEARQALPDEGIRQLAALGQQIQKEYGFPQDIEWAVDTRAGGSLYILQSRPITSLFPLPYERREPLDVWFSFGSVQGMLGPMTPLGRDALQKAVGGLGKRFGARPHSETSGVMAAAGERLWLKASDLMRNPLGRRVYPLVLNMVEPSVGQILRRLADNPHLGAGKGRLQLKTVRRVLGFFLPVLARFPVTMHDPVKARRDFETLIESELVQPHVTGGDKFARLAQRLQFMDERTTAVFTRVLQRFIPLIGSSMASLNLLTKLTAHDVQADHGFSALTMEVTRGLPGNVTTEMDLALWEAAAGIRSDPDTQAFFRDSDAAGLARGYLDGTLPPAVQQSISNFMARYGMRGVGEVDLGQPRWREEPAAIMQTLQSYLKINPELAPDVLFGRGAQAASDAIEKLAAAARRGPGGRWKEKIVRFAARRIRTLMGIREAPKFYAVRMMGIVRKELLASGREFAEAGILERPGDLFFLHFDELEALAKNETRDWKAIVARRRSAYEREERRRQVPRVIASDGRAFYEGLGAAEESGATLTGSPVSPGVVEGAARIIFDPRGAQLLPGEILVCPGTDPAWTPLFMAAGGLITEVGGMMTHGSVVAREYGIPAVVGVHQATERLKNGQRIRVDGTTGKILVLPASSDNL